MLKDVKHKKLMILKLKKDTKNINSIGIKKVPLRNLYSFCSSLIEKNMGETAFLK